MKVEIVYKREVEASDILDVTEEELKALSDGNMPEWIEEEMEHELDMNTSYTDYCVNDLNGTAIVHWS